MSGPVDLYKDCNVRERIAEFCGGEASNPSQFTAEYLVGYGDSLGSEGLSQGGLLSTSPNEFISILDKGLDIFRSIWDRQSILGILNTCLLYTSDAADE